MTVMELIFCNITLIQNYESPAKYTIPGIFFEVLRNANISTQLVEPSLFCLFVCLKWLSARTMGIRGGWDVHG